MKRFVSLALAAAMTLSLVPVSAFAATDNRVTTPVSIAKGDVTGEDVTAGELVIKNDKGDIKGNFEFELNLTGGEWVTEDDGFNNLLKVTGNDFVTAATNANADLVSGKYGVDWVVYKFDGSDTYTKVETQADLEKLSSSDIDNAKVVHTSANFDSTKLQALPNKFAKEGTKASSTALNGAASTAGFETPAKYEDKTGTYIVFLYNETTGKYEKLTKAESEMTDAEKATALVVEDKKIVSKFAADNAEFIGSGANTTTADGLIDTALDSGSYAKTKGYDSSKYAGMTYGVDYVVYKAYDTDSDSNKDSYKLVKDVTDGITEFPSIEYGSAIVITDAKPLSALADTYAADADSTTGQSKFNTATTDAKTGAYKNSKDYVGVDVTSNGVSIKRMSATKVLVKVTGVDSFNMNNQLRIQLGGIEATGDKIEVAVTPTSGSPISATTLTVGNVTTGATLTTVEKLIDIRDKEVETLKPILIEETDYDTFEAGKDLTIKLNSGFEFVGADKASVGTVEVLKGDGVADTAATLTKIDSRTLRVTLKGNASTKETAIRLSNIEVKTDGAKSGDVATITVDGAGVTRQTIEVGKVYDYSVAVKAEDKDLPVIYSGVIDNDLTNNETLELTIEENTQGSWLAKDRTTTIKLPEGVKVAKLSNGVLGCGIEVVSKNCDNVQYNGSSSVSALESAIVDVSDDCSEIYIKGLEAINKDKEMKYTLKFTLNVAPNFTGDIAAEVSGAAVGETQKATIAKAVAPVSVEAEKTSVAIDYRNVDVKDITVTEAAAGVWEKGQKVVLEVDKMDFESGIKAEVLEGDGEIKALEVDGGRITITVDSESSKTPMKIKLSGVSLYLQRDLPAGDYALKLVTAGNTTINDNASDSDSIASDNAVMFETYMKNDTESSKFNVSSVTAIKDYVTVSTAGRDQGTTFTTEVKVTIDSTTMIIDGKETTLDVPAYLSAEGWTMLPVRAVTEALASASNSQPVDWIAGNPGTIMIYYGDKTVAMTLGSTTMYINGTPVPMSTAPVIVNDRAFLPMRDLGRALGLSDSQIAWDAATRTATFNPAATTTAK